MKISLYSGWNERESRVVNADKDHETKGMAEGFLKDPFASGKGNEAVN